MNKQSMPEIIHPHKVDRLEAIYKVILDSKRYYGVSPTLDTLAEATGYRAWEVSVSLYTLQSWGWIEYWTDTGYIKISRPSEVVFEPAATVAIMRQLRRHELKKAKGEQS